MVSGPWVRQDMTRGERGENKRRGEKACYITELAVIAWCGNFHSLWDDLRKLCGSSWTSGQNILIILHVAAVEWVTTPSPGAERHMAWRLGLSHTP